MANRRDYYFRQPVAEDELDVGFNELELADHQLQSDNGLVGVVLASLVNQHSSPNLTVDVSGPGVVYDQTGQRIAWGSTQNVNVAVDSLAVSTTVAGGGNEKWVSVFAKFTRTLSDPRTDGNAATVYFVRAESFQFIVEQGAEAAIGAATRPALKSDAILLGDINRRNGQTQINNSDIAAQNDSTTPVATTRREDAFVLTAGASKVRAGTAEAAMQGVLGIVAATAASGVTYAGSPNWLDSTAVSGANVEAAIDEVVTDLTNTASPNSGAHKVGCGNRTTWLGGRTNAGGVSIFTAIDKIITDLAATGAGDDGAERIGIQARTTWLGGRTNAAADVFAAIDKIITDLAATASNDDGAERIGTQAAGDLAGGSVRAQLNELDTGWGKLGRANTWTNAQRFDGVAGDTNPSLKTSVSATARKLLWEIDVGNTAKGRIYGRKSGSDTLLEFTLNAAWDGSNWQRDNTGTTAQLYTFDGAGIQFRGAASGANPITFTLGANLQANVSGSDINDSIGVTESVIGASNTNNTHAYAGIQVDSPAGGGNLKVGGTFHAKFASTPTTLSVTVVGSNTNVTGTPTVTDVDTNGASISIVCTSANTLTKATYRINAAN